MEKGAFKISVAAGGREITSWFAFEGYFFTELESYRSRQRTRFDITAIENNCV